MSSKENVPVLQTHHVVVLYDRKDKNTEKQVAKFIEFAEGYGLKIILPRFGPEALEGGDYVKKITACVKQSRKILILISR